MTPAARLTWVAVVTQSGLALAALAGARVAGIRVSWGALHPALAAAAGLATAGVLAAVNFRLLQRPIGVWRAVRAAVDDVLVPTFAVLTSWQIAAISVAAGVGEELFFRGFLQPLVGVAAAAAAFGVAHVAGARMVGFGVWAAGMGLVMGALALVTGGILAAMMAHVCYDMLAFQYLRAVARRPERQGV